LVARVRLAKATASDPGWRRGGVKAKERPTLSSAEYAPRRLSLQRLRVATFEHECGRLCQSFAPFREPYAPDWLVRSDYDLYVAANCDPDLQFAVRGQLVARDQALEPWIPPQWRIEGIDPQQRKRDRGRDREQVFELVEGGIVLPGPYIDLNQVEHRTGSG